jgi:hypothetical protein
MNRKRHTDWWKCEMCEVIKPIITDAYRYEIFCPVCHRTMILMVRTEDDSPPPFPGKRDDTHRVGIGGRVREV